MRRNMIVLGIALVAALVVGMSVVAANPAIIVPPRVRLGESVTISGQGFPANQPVQASLVAQNFSYPLPYQGGAAAAPLTDGTGAFQNLAFSLSVPAQITATDGEIFIGVGSATARAPVGIDASIANTAGRGDKIAVSIGATFFVVVAILILLLLRGLPIYPIGQTTAQRVRETETQ